MNNEDSLPITPINFIQIRAECRYLPNKKNFLEGHYEKYALPLTSEWCAEEHFADLSVGWNEEGLSFFAMVHQPIQQITYPDLSRGDNIELFIDTRDVKTSGFNTRFCHHFFFLPESLNGIHAGELTRFRTEDMHELCDPKELKVKKTAHKQGYSLAIFIPSALLCGYDPEHFSRIGFSYRINRPDGEPQHFSVVTDDYQLEQQPSLWASLRLIK